MKETLNTYEIADRLFRDENAGWSYNGAKALAEFLDVDENEDAEFDRVAIRCDFSEYATALEAARSYGFDWTPELYDADDNERDADEVEEELEKESREWLESRTTVLSFDGGVIVHDF
jgi:hypothetical protein